MVFELKKVLISDEVDPKCVSILQANGVEVTKNTKLSKEQLLNEIPAYDGLIVRSATKVTADVINAGRRLKIIGRAGTGVDNIDCNAATKAGVIVMNTPGGNTLSAAEHTCAMMCAMTRFIPQGTESLKAGRWDRKKYMGNELYGKTLAIIGLGRIGKEVALRMQSFGMTTIGFDPIIPASVSAEFNTKWMPLEELWPLADYITVHTPLIPQTKHMINDNVFAKCKKGVRVVNCARGGIIDEDALLRALQSGQCAGAGLDVFVEEPPTNMNLVNHPNVVSTPHLGASTVEAQSRVAEEIAQQFVDTVQGKSLFGALNAQALTNALSPNTRPWVTLGQMLGHLAARLASDVNSKTQVQVTTFGDSMSNAGSYMSAAVLSGLLKPVTNNGLNLINSPAIAKEMGLQISTDHQTVCPSPHTSACSVTVQQPGGAIHQLVGSAAGGTPLLFELNGAKFPRGVQLSGHTVLYRAQANNQVLSAVAGALAGNNATILSYACSETSNNETWGIMQLATSVDNVDVLNLHVDYVQQVCL